MRQAINVIGRFLLTFGLLLLLFVGYQLWGTGFYESRAQSDLHAKFRTALNETRQAERPVSGTTTTTTPLPPPPEGDPVGIIRIPKIGLDRTIVQGVTVPDLRKGPGHYPDSPMPGQLGNAAIAGHRTTYGQPFNQIDELAPGDEITILTLNGTYHYTVTEQLVVSPREVAVLDPTPDATLTLTTCHPKFSASQRLIVKARLDVEHSPAPVKPKSSAVTHRRLAVDDLAGKRESRVPVWWSGLAVALVGGLWWFCFHRRPRWYVWVAGAIPFLAVYAVFCFYLERVLPPGF
ncbi:MAG: class E sortase [Acidimicrobiia bacterium]